MPIARPAAASNPANVVVSTPTNPRIVATSRMLSRTFMTLSA